MIGVLPQPPTNLSVSHTAELVATTTMYLLAMGLVVVTVAVGRRTGTPMYALISLACAAGAINEPLGDILYRVYHPVQGQWIAFTAFDRSIPWHIFADYMVYFGGLGCLLFYGLQNGLGRRYLWSWIGGVIAFDLLFEIPLGQLDFWNYYGYHPMMVAGLPLYVIFINMSGAVAMAVTAVGCQRLAAGRLAGVRRKIYGGFVMLGPVILLCSYSVALPAFYTMNSEAPHLVKWLGASVTIAFSLWVFDFAFRMVSAWNSSAAKGGAVGPEGRTPPIFVPQADARPEKGDGVSSNDVRVPG